MIFQNLKYCDSTYYCKHGEFKNYFRAIDDKSVPVPHSLATFREVRYLHKKPIQSIRTASSKRLWSCGQ
jgi:hypothetical protein